MKAQYLSHDSVKIIALITKGAGSKDNVLHYILYTFCTVDLLAQE